MSIQCLSVMENLNPKKKTRETIVKTFRSKNIDIENVRNFSGRNIDCASTDQGSKTARVHKGQTRAALVNAMCSQYK